jgi:hypothetical protein
MIETIKSTSHESIDVQPTTARQTPPDAKARFGEAMKQSAMVLLGAASGVATVLPAGGMLSAAIRTGTAASTGAVPVGQSPAGPGSLAGTVGAGGSELDQMRQIQQEGLASSMEVLEIQQRIGRENRVFSTLSNVMKARHETARTAINNIR